MSEVAHQLGLVPLAAMLLFGRNRPRAYWLVALAFGVSWLADSIARGSGGAWSAAYWWLPAQFALLLLAIMPVERLRLGMLALLAAALASVVLSSPGPDVLLTVVGSALVLWHADGALGVPLAAYFGAGSIAYLGMIWAMGGQHFMPAWYAYQTCRLVAACLFVGIVLYQRGGRSWTVSSSPRRFFPA